MYLGMDGTGVPMRSQEVVDRAGKQADSSAKTREAKLVTLSTAESRDEDCATQDRSPTRAPLKAPPLAIPVATSKTLPHVYSVRPAVAVSTKPHVRQCRAMVRPGFGTRRRNYSRGPLRFSTAFMPKNISVRQER